MKKSTGTLYWYDVNGNVLVETQADPAGSWNEAHVYFGGKRILRHKVSGAVRYIFADHLGSASFVGNFNGTIMEETDFYPYGGTRVISSAESNAYKFTGKERDGESGLDYFIARHYGSAAARFWSPDPLMVVRQKLVDPQQWAMYSYARNNPLRFLDPTGQRVALPGDPDERAKFLEALRAAVGAKAGALLTAIFDKKKGTYFLSITGAKEGDFRNLNAVADKLGGLILDKNRTATLKFVSPGTKVLNSTIGAGPERSPAATTVTPDTATVHVTSGDVGSVPGKLLESGKTTATNLSQVLMHELGHIDGAWYHGGQALGQLGNTLNASGDAVRIENQVRQMQGFPLRIGESEPYDVPLTNMPY